MAELLTMSGGHVAQDAAAPTATIEEEDFQYFADLEAEADLDSDQQSVMTAERPVLVRVATCGSAISHVVKTDPRYWSSFI